MSDFLTIAKICPSKEAIVLKLHEETEKETKMKRCHNFISKLEGKQNETKNKNTHVQNYQLLLR